MASVSDPQNRDWQGPSLFSYGFRVFFLFGALWAVISMILWLGALIGLLDLASQFDPTSWHAHEFLFGYLGAIVAGFLLTAVPNWTGRRPLVGWPLIGLFALWFAGRLANLISGMLPFWIAPSIDLAFPLVLGAVVLREIIAGRNWRNLIILGLLASLMISNALFYIEDFQGAYAPKGTGFRLGLATGLMMIAVIGGRIIPAFTGNWLKKRDNPARPAPPMQGYDKLTLLASLAIFALWVLQPATAASGMALVVFGALHLARQMRWQPLQTTPEPLLFVLHAAYAFLPLGAFAMGIAQLTEAFDPQAAQHIWMAGALGGMTLAVMTRATLGHTGQALTANRMTLVLFIALLLSVATRLADPWHGHFSWLSGQLWIVAYGLFLITYGPALIRPRPGADV